MAVHELLRRPLFPLLVGVALVFALLTSLVPTAQSAPYGPFNRADEDWQVYETKHFRFYSGPNTQRTLAHLMGIADGIYEELNAFYDYQPKEKLTVTVIGFSGYANGFAEYAKNRITIFPTPPNFIYRSRMPWLENVFTHELSHVLSLNTATASIAKLPLALITGIVRHKIGIPLESSIRIPVLGGNNPHWYREGIAQYDTARVGYDGFDENRRAYQRANWEDGRFFALEKLAFFGGEKWYNGGFGFLLYLEELFGRDAVHDLTKAMGSRYYYRFEDVFADVFEVPFEELEATYRQRVEANYQAHLAKAQDGKLDGKPLQFETTKTPPYRDLVPEERGYLYRSYRATPVAFQDGRFFYRQGSIVKHGLLDPQSGTITDAQTIGVAQAIAPRTQSSHFILREEGQSPSPVPFYHRPDYETSSLFVVNAEGETELIASEARLHDIATCPQAALMAAVHNDGDGSLRLALYNVEHFDHDDPKQVSLGQPSFPLSPVPFDEVRHPRFSPDCSRVYFSRRVGVDHDLLMYDVSSRVTETVAGQSAFELYPSPTEDGVYFVSARDGSMSVYFQDLDPTTDPVRVTHAVTAHHYPVAVSDGVVVGRLYSTGLHLHHQTFVRQAAPAKPSFSPPRASSSVAAKSPEATEPATPSDIQTSSDGPTEPAPAITADKAVPLPQAETASEPTPVPAAIPASVPAPMQLGSDWPVKPSPPAQAVPTHSASSESYSGLSNTLSPSLVPMLYFELDTDRSYGASMRVQGGIELYMEDQLRQHSLLVRGFAGARSSILAGYRNRTTPLTFYVSGGMTKIKSLYTYESTSGSNEQRFERVADYNWGFYNASASLPLNLFHYLTLSTSTILDTGSILGAAEPPFTWSDPRYSRTLSGLTLSFVGLDKSSPTFSQREINKRGYRKFDVRVFHGREYSSPYLTRYDPNLGKTVHYVRAEGSLTEYIALPKLKRGWFDHTLQVDLHLGFISHNVNFLPFIGGGRLYSLTAPELNTSVGFVGYDFYSLTGETVLNLGLTYRFPLLRNLGWSFGPIYLQDLYAQVFTSWGNIWGYSENADGTFKRQVPFMDAAPNGQHILGDVGVDLRLGHYFQELNANFGTTIRAAYRLVPFSSCPYDDVTENPACLDDGGRRALSLYLMVGGGF